MKAAGRDLENCHSYGIDSLRLAKIAHVCQKSANLQVGMSKLLNGKMHDIKRPHYLVDVSADATVDDFTTV